MNYEGDGNVKKYPELTVLGSASAMPGKYRNNSSYLVEVT
jgi:ribonuclease BN (tRNA processing enzyme)